VEQAVERESSPGDVQLRPTVEIGFVIMTRRKRTEGVQGQFSRGNFC
jgi:hypothetical protein